MWEITHSRSKNGRKLRIYLKNNAEFNSNVGPTATSNHSISGLTVYNFGSTPYVDVEDDFDVLKQNELLPKIFLKATIVTSAKYYTYRDYGIYVYGKARAELILTEKYDWYLKIETSSWEGIADMKALQEKLWAGTIAPVVYYGNKQKKQHPLNVLRQILDSKNLTIFQRFFLALRLAK